MKKYPVTYKGLKYTVKIELCEEQTILSKHYNYKVEIYKGIKKWYSNHVYQYVIYCCKNMTYIDAVKITFINYQREILDKEEKEQRNIKEFEEWDGVIE